MKKIIATFSLFGLSALSLLLARAQTTTPTPTGDLFQFNNLIVRSATQSGTTGELVAARQTAQCIRYASLDAKTGIKSICPLPPGSSAESATYRIAVQENTALLLRNREKGKLADFIPNDQINVYGFYREDGSIHALTVRNITKPIPQSGVQLNNTEIIGISTSSPKTLVVIQNADASCTRFEGTMGKKSVCPIGLRAISDGVVAGRLVYPASVTAKLNSVRKYEVIINMTTTVLDREKKPMSPDLLTIGDTINIFGSYETKTTAPQINAEVVRDLSRPKLTKASRQFDGVVTQINASDGSFILRSRTGELVMVLSPVQYNAFLNIKGGYDETTDTFTAVDQITVKPQISANAIPIVTLLNPGIASIGTHIAVQGSGFTKTGNAVNFGAAYIPNIASPDGTTLMFTVPATITMKCHLATPPCLAPVVPIVEGEYVVSVENGNGTSNTGKFTVAPLPPLSITTPSLPQVVEQTRYTATVEARGGTGTYGWAISRGSLPPGLSLVRAACVLAPCRMPLAIIGTPTTSGTYPVTLTLTSGGETTSRDFEIVVVAALGRGY